MERKVLDGGTGRLKGRKKEIQPRLLEKLWMRRKLKGVGKRRKRTCGRAEIYRQEWP